MKSGDITEAVEVHACVKHYAELIAELDTGGNMFIRFGADAEIDADTPELVAAIRTVLADHLEFHVRELEALGIQGCDRNTFINAAKDLREKRRGY